jgi:hypothetical protein
MDALSTTTPSAGIPLNMAFCYKRQPRGALRAIFATIDIAYKWPQMTAWRSLEPKSHINFEALA